MGSIITRMIMNIVSNIVISIFSSMLIVASCNAEFITADNLAADTDRNEKLWHFGTLQHDKLARHYRYFLPENMPGNAVLSNVPEKRPMVILLHGGTRSMNLVFNKRSGASRYWPELAQQEGFILVAPNGINAKNGNASGDKQNWNDCRDRVPGTNSDTGADDVGFIARLIDELAKTLSIDTSRIYVTGASNGGMMTYRVAAELGHKIAAAAVFIANEPDGKECNQQNIAGPVPLMIMNGTKDKFIPWDGGDAPGKTGKLFSVDETINIWAARNAVNPDVHKITRIANSNKKDGSTVELIVFEKGPESADLWLYKVSGGGHNIPSDLYSVPKLMQWTLLGKQNKDINGVAEAWRFLSMHHR